MSEEPRSFAPTGERVKRPPPSGRATLPELRLEVFGVHQCLEVTSDKVDAYHAEAMKGFADAATDREALRDEVGEIKAAIAKYDRAWKRAAAIVAWIVRWRRRLYVAGAFVVTTVLASIITTLVTGVMAAAHPPVDKSYVDSKAANRYTAADAARDKAAQAAQDAKLADLIAKIEDRETRR